MKKFGIVLLCCSVMAQVASTQSIVTYYVSPGGSDARSCTEARSASTPKRTIRDAVQCLAAGATLLVRGGTYPEAIESAIAPGSSWDNKVRIAAYDGETVWLKPPAGPPWVISLMQGQQFLEFDGINLDTTNATVSSPMGGLDVDSTSGYNATHIRFQNATILGNRVPGDLLSSRVAVDLNGTGDVSGANEIRNVTIRGSGGQNSFYGMYIHTSDNLVEGCDVSDVSLLGIQIYDGTAPPSNNIIRGTRVHDIRQAFDNRRMGILLAGNNNLVYNNIVYNVNSDGSGDGSAINLYSGSGNRVINNTVANNQTRAIELVHATNTSVMNNLAFGNNSNGITDSGSSGTSATTNLFGVDPKFVAAGMFQLDATSPAIDAGTSTALVPFDFLGVPRPQGRGYDIGAIEFTNQNAVRPPSHVRLVQ